MSACSVISEHHAVSSFSNEAELVYLLNAVCGVSVCEHPWHQRWQFAASFCCLAIIASSVSVLPSFLGFCPVGLVQHVYDRCGWKCSSWISHHDLCSAVLGLKGDSEFQTPLACSLQSFLSPDGMLQMLTVTLLHSRIHAQGWEKWSASSVEGSGIPPGQ